MAPRFPRLRVGLPNSLVSVLVARRVSEGGRRASHDCRRIAHGHLAAPGANAARRRTCAPLVSTARRAPRHKEIGDEALDELIVLIESLHSHPDEPPIGARLEWTDLHDLGDDVQRLPWMH